MEELIREWGYIVLFLYSLGGGFIALAIAAVLSFSGELNIVITLIVAGIANFIGDQLLFYLARNNSSYAKSMLNKHRRKLAYSNLLMRKYGWLAIFIQKYIYGVKTLIPIAIGLTKYNTLSFMIFNFFATIAWTLIIGLGAYLLGEVFLNIADDIKVYLIGFIILLVTAIFYKIRKI